MSDKPSYNSLARQEKTRLQLVPKKSVEFFTEHLKNSSVPKNHVVFAYPTFPKVKAVESPESTTYITLSEEEGGKYVNEQGNNGLLLLKCGEGCENHFDKDVLRPGNLVKFYGQALQSFYIEEKHPEYPEVDDLTRTYIMGIVRIENVSMITVPENPITEW